MNISEKRKFLLYKSISDPITDLRVSINLGKVTDIDKELFVLEQRIYREIKQALNIEGKAKKEGKI